MRHWMKILPLLMVACIAATAPSLPPTQPAGPNVGILSQVYNPATMQTTVVFGLTWGAPQISTGQAPVTGYRTYICHGPLAVAADTLVERTVGNVLQDSITVVIPTDTLTQITGVVRTVDSQGRVSGIAGSGPITFNAFPTAPNPPSNPTIRQVSP